MTLSLHIPVLDESLGLPYPSLARISKAEAASLLARYQAFDNCRLVGNIFAPYFFPTRTSGNNLYLLRLHVDVPDNPTVLHEYTVTESHIERASDVYVRLRMDWPHLSHLERRFRGPVRRLGMNSPDRRVRIVKSEAQKIVRELRDSEYDDWWSIYGTIGGGEDDRDLRILGLGQR